MTKKVKMPEKPRKHRWVTEALNEGERVFYISNPGLGLWALRAQFQDEQHGR